MRKIQFTFLLLIAITSISFATTQNPSTKCLPKNDNQYRKLILGNWYSEDRFPNGIIYLEKQSFFINGDLFLNFTEKAHPGKTVATIKAKWSINNGRLHEQALSASSPEFDLGNAVTIDQILCLDQHLLQLRAENGSILKRFRVIEKKTK